jgi:hypothetical protein
MRERGTQGISMATTIGPDGFVCMASDLRAHHHAALDAFLRARQAGSANVDEAAFAHIRKGLKKAELVVLVLAIYQRLDGIEAHRDELAEAAHIAQALARLAFYLYRASLPFDEPALRALLAAHRRHATLWFDTAPGIVADYVAETDLTRRSPLRSGVSRPISRQRCGKQNIRDRRRSKSRSSIFTSFAGTMSGTRWISTAAAPRPFAAMSAR